MNKQEQWIRVKRTFNKFFNREIFHVWKYEDLKENSFQTRSRTCECGRVEVYDVYFGGTWMRVK